VSVKALYVRQVVEVRVKGQEREILPQAQNTD